MVAAERPVRRLLHNPIVAGSQSIFVIQVALDWILLFYNVVGGHLAKI